MVTFTYLFIYLIINVILPIYPLILYWPWLSVKGLFLSFLTILLGCQIDNFHDPKITVHHLPPLSLRSMMSSFLQDNLPLILINKIHRHHLRDSWFHNKKLCQIVIQQKTWIQSSNFSINLSCILVDIICSLISSPIWLKRRRGFPGDHPRTRLTCGGAGVQVTLVE